VPGTTFSADFSPDGRRVVTGGVDGAVRIWDATTGRAIAVVHEHAASVDVVAFSPDGRSILSTGDDKTARIYPCEPCASLRTLRALARDRTSRALTAEERRRYGGA
jgi:WD40 repeat protein